MRLQMIIALLVAFGLGVLAGRSTGPTALAQNKAASDPYAEMLHVGVVVKNLDQAVARWKAMGFSDIRVSPPNKGVDRTYHGKPIDVALKQAFVHGTRPMIELMEPVGDSPSPWGEYLKEHGEALHHVAFRIPDTGPELEKYRALGLEAIASGKWPEGPTRWGTFHYVQDSEGGRDRRVSSRASPGSAPDRRYRDDSSLQACAPHTGNARLEEGRLGTGGKALQPQRFPESDTLKDTSGVRKAFCHLAGQRGR